MRTLLSWIATVAFWLALAAPAVAVDLNSTIKGTITDADGLAVPRVALTLTSPALQGDRTTESDEQGRYRFSPLPPGEYVITASKSGFRDWQSLELKIPIATTVQVDIELPLKGSADEEITVIGAAPAVDVENTTMKTVLDADFLKNIPYGGDYHSATAVTPGIVGSGNPNMHGGFDTANQFYIDGVNVTDPMTNTFSVNMNLFAIDAIEIITGGMDAEYGQSLGGAINIVTKSGGNEFEGSVTATYHHAPGMIVAPTLPGEDFADNTEQQLTVNFGGPIIKDRVWFYTSFEGNRSVSTPSIEVDSIPRDLDRFPLQPRDWRSIYLFGKVTAQLNPANRVWFHAQTDNTTIFNVEQSPYVLPSAETIQKQPGWLLSLGHQLTPSDRVLIENQAYFQKSIIDWYSILWQYCEEFDEDGICTDDFSDMNYLGQTVGDSWYGYSGNDLSSGASPLGYFSRRYRTSANSSITLYGDLLGEHKAKAGVQAEYMRSSELWPGYAEGYAYYTSVGDINNLDGYRPVLFEQWDSGVAVKLDAVLLSAYLQDVYKPFPGLTVRPGLRLDTTQLNDEAGESVFSSVNLAPRIGAAYDLGGKGKTSLRAYYGRFYDAGYLWIASLLKRTSEGYDGYNWDADAGDWDFDSPAYSVSDAFLSHELKNPYSDEFNFGLSRELGTDFAMDLTFIYEYASRFWEDDEVNLIWNDDATDVIGSRDGTDEAIYRLRTPTWAFTRYTSIELTFRKTYSERWALLGSYTWSRAYGTQSWDGASGWFDTPEQRKYEIGLVDHDVTHSIKVAGSYSEPDVATLGRLSMGYTLGWNFLARSGFPYRQLVWSNYWQGYWNYTGIGDGRYRLPMFSQTDLRAGLSFDYDERVNWQVGVDMFNVFNDRTITDVDWSYDPEATGGDQTFGDILDRQYPRWLQLYVQGEF